MTPISWYEVDRPPVPGDGCLWCNKTRGGHDDFACAKWTDPDDVCPVCNGVGVLGDVRRSDYDGRRCHACGGDGYLESSSVEEDPA